MSNINIKDIIREKVNQYAEKIEQTVVDHVQFILETRGEDMVASAISTNVAYLDDDIETAIAEEIDTLVEDNIKMYIDCDLADQVESELDNYISEAVAEEMSSTISELF